MELFTGSAVDDIKPSSFPSAAAVAASRVVPHSTKPDYALTHRFTLPRNEFVERVLTGRLVSLAIREYTADLILQFLPPPAPTPPGKSSASAASSAAASAAAAAAAAASGDSSSLSPPSLSTPPSLGLQQLVLQCMSDHPLSALNTLIGRSALSDALAAAFLEGDSEVSGWWRVSSGAVSRAGAGGAAAGVTAEQLEAEIAAVLAEPYLAVAGPSRALVVFASIDRCILFRKTDDWVGVLLCCAVMWCTHRRC